MPATEPPEPCVEAAKPADGWIALRDNKDPDGPGLVFTVSEWCAFEDGMGKGEFAYLLEP